MTEVQGGRGVKIWRCPSHKGAKVSLRQGSFWERSKLTLCQLLKICWAWAYKTNVDYAATMMEVDRCSVMTWYGYLRDVCSHQMLQNPLQIGGPGVVVQIDETLMAKRKNNVGRVVVQHWVFGGFCPAQNVGFFHFVDRRDAATLLPIIQRYILPGTIIHSDMWAAYNGIAALPVNPPYTHQTVNHTQNFVDPVTDAHTNTVECYWKNAKLRFKAMCGNDANTMDAHLDEFMWRNRYSPNNNPRDVFFEVVDQIAQWYVTP